MNTGFKLSMFERLDGLVTGLTALMFPVLTLAVLL